LVSRPDIVIVEGLNVLQVGPSRGRKTPRLFVSDFFDFTIYVDAPAETIRSWYLERFNLFRERARQDPGAYFHRFSTWSDARASRFAAKVWAETNEQNLLKNILPYRERARLILCKGARHAVEEVLLRRI
ncbi:MAG TPA: type I pantothenate kinase, partial [Myxococcota bacterium]|nr:type I pantothenate kinase [Myxococcota bacterium]